MKFHSLVTAAASYAALSSASQAVGIIGIGSDNNFYQFDSASPGSVAQFGPNGAASGLVDIDIHGANGLLYGIAAGGAVSSINYGNGGLTAAYSPLTAYGSAVTAFDHNPFADRVRIVAGNSNFRIVPNVVTPPQAAGTPGTVTTDGSFSFFDSTGTSARSGVTILGVGYTFPIDNPASTSLFSITSDGFLNSHTSPAGSFGTGLAVGVVGLGFIPVGAGFDIGLDGFGYAFDGSALSQINLTTGTSTSFGAIGLPGGVSLTSLAVIPEPSSILLGSLAGLALLRRRRGL